MGEVLLWVGLFTLSTVSIGGMGRGLVALCTSFAWFLFTVFTVGEHLHVWSEEACTWGEACCLRRLESLCGPSSAWGLLGSSGGHASC